MEPKETVIRIKGKTLSFLVSLACSEHGLVSLTSLTKRQDDWNTISAQIWL